MQILCWTAAFTYKPFSEMKHKNSTKQHSHTLSQTHSNRSKDNALVVLIVIRVTQQTVHGIETVLSKQIVEAYNGVLLADSLDWIINGQWRGQATLVAVGAEEIITALANTKKTNHIQKENQARHVAPTV